MVRGPKSGNGMRSSVYSLAAPDLGSLDLGSRDRGFTGPGLGAPSGPFAR